jgi:hypothetical protein
MLSMVLCAWLVGCQGAAAVLVVQTVWGQVSPLTATQAGMWLCWLHCSVLYCSIHMLQPTDSARGIISGPTTFVCAVCTFSTSLVCGAWLCFAHVHTVNGSVTVSYCCHCAVAVSLFGSQWDPYLVAARVWAFRGRHCSPSGEEGT